MKKLLASVSALLAFLSLPPVAFAQIKSLCPPDPFNKLCFQSGDIKGILGGLIAFIFILATVAAVFFLLWGATRWILSGGDKAAIESARGTIVASIIGLVILFLVFLIINILLGFFNVNINNITPLPTIPTPVP